MWKYVLPPVALVAVLWIAMAAGTTSYMNWVESSYDRVIDENLSSIELADTVQDTLKRLAILLPGDGLPGDEEIASSGALSRMLPFWRLIREELRSLRIELTATAHSEQEREELSVNAALFADISQIGDALFAPDLTESERNAEGSKGKVPSTETLDAQTLRQRLASLASQLDASMTVIKNVNRKIADESAQKRKRWGTWVSSLRTGLLVLGPLIGLLLGWRLSKRLQNTVTRIAVTLKQADNESIEVGEWTVAAQDELSDMQAQAEAMVAKLKKTHLDLEISRIEGERTARLASVGRLAAGVAHELRNPLTSVKLLLQNARRQASAERLNDSDLELILEEIGRMESTIEGLLDFSRVRPLDAQRHDVRETVRRALHLLEGQASQQRVAIEFEDPGRPFEVLGDPEMLHQVYVNLMLNAIESMRGGGRLSIRILPVSPSRFRIEIQDSGPGIAPEIFPRLFEPFATTKERGTGLGLAISRQIVDRHGGLLTAENLPEGGSKFMIEFAMEAPVPPLQSPLFRKD